MVALWIKLFSRPLNQLRVLALLLLALLAGLAMVVSLTTNRYTLPRFGDNIAAGWADLHLVTRENPTQALRLAGLPTSALVTAPLYEFTTPRMVGAGPAYGPTPLVAVFSVEEAARLPLFLTSTSSAPGDAVGPRAAQPRLRRNEAWVSRWWADAVGVRVGDHITLSLQHSGGVRRVTVEVRSVAYPATYLLAPEALYIALAPEQLPQAAESQRWAVLGSLGAERLEQITAALSGIVERGAELLPNESLLLAIATQLDHHHTASAYSMVRVVSRAASAFMSLLACLAIACALWLATSLYRRGALEQQGGRAQLLLGLQLLALYWAGIGLGALLGSVAPNMLALPDWGLEGAPSTDSALMLSAVVLLAGIAAPIMPALAWVRGRPQMSQLRVSRRGNQLRAGLMGGVILSIMLGLILYAATWWPGESLLLYNTLAALVTGVIAGVGPLAVSWNRDETYVKAARSAGVALFICLLVTTIFVLAATVLIGWSAHQVEGTAPELLGIWLVSSLAFFAVGVLVAIALALSVGALSGVLVVAFWRRTTASDRETMAENTIRIESLLLLSRLVIAIVIGISIAPASAAPATGSILNLYLLAVLALSVLLRTWPRRLLLWSTLSSLVDAAAISTLVALDGGLESPFYLLYFLALLGVTMRFSGFVSLAASIEFSLLYVVALVSAESWTLITGEGVRQNSISNRVVLLICFGLLASLLAREHQRALQRLDRANQRLLENAGLRRELEIARQVQQNLFPQELPRLPGLRMAARCLPARETGGDFFDMLPLDDQRLALVVCDVSGKSVPAAMVMAMARSAFRAPILDGHGPAIALSKANLTLQGAGRGMFTAAQYALFDLRQRTLTLSSAGQLAPMLRREGSVTLLQPPGPALPLGIVANGSYQEQTYQLQTGDLLLFYTDGVVESMNGERQLFGFERLEELLKASHGLPDGNLLERLIAELGAFSGSAEQHDDMTLVVIEVVDN